MTGSHISDVDPTHAALADAEWIIRRSSTVVAPLMEAWGQAIRDARIAKGRSQGWLADQLGLDQSLVSLWENGRRAPNIEKQLAIARLLGAKVAQLFPLPGEDVA